MHTFPKKVGGCTNRSVPRHSRDPRPCSGAKIQGGPSKDARWPYHIRTGLGKSGWAGNPVHPPLLAKSSISDQADAVGIDCGLPEQLYDIDWRKQIGDTSVTFCALSGAADPSSVCANPRPPCDWHPGRSACSAGRLAAIFAEAFVRPEDGRTRQFRAAHPP